MPLQKITSENSGKKEKQSSTKIEDVANTNLKPPGLSKKVSMMGGMDSMVKPPSLNRDNSVLHSNPVIDKSSAKPSLPFVKSSIEKIASGSEETTAANSKAKASTGDSFLRPPSPSTQK